MTIVLHRLAEALIPKPPPAWLIDGIFSAGSFNIMFVPAGSYKTWSAIDMMMCVALGIPWLGRQTIQGPVLHVDEEMGAAWFEQRLRWVANGHNADDTTPIAYTCMSGLDLRQMSNVQELGQILAAEQPILMVVDALADVMPGGDENSVKDMMPLFRNLRTLANTYHVSTVLLHHPNKAGIYRGSSALPPAVDLLLSVEADPVKREVIFRSGKIRHGGLPFQINAKVVDDPIEEALSLKFLSSTLPQPKPRHYAPSRQYVLNHL
jgi:hypothetical protein